MKRKLTTKISAAVSGFAGTVLAAGSLLAPLAAHAAVNSDGTWTQAGSPGATTLTFTDTSAVSAGDKYTLIFPTEAAVDAVGTNVTVTGLTGGSGTTRVNNGQAITLTVTGTATASSVITITLADALSAYTGAATYAAQGMSILHSSGAGAELSRGVAMLYNDNTTDVSATVSTFLNLAVDTTTINLGNLTSAAVAEQKQIYTLNTNNSTGASLKIAADAKLNAGAADIDDVADNAVTAGSEEYGVNLANFTADVGSPNLAGVGAFGGGDDTIPVVATTLASVGAPTSNAKFDLNYRASVNASTTQFGVYDQVVTMTAVANP